MLTYAVQYCVVLYSAVTSCAVLCKFLSEHRGVGISGRRNIGTSEYRGVGISGVGPRAWNLSTLTPRPLPPPVVVVGELVVVVVVVVVIVVHGGGCRTNRVSDQ